jgi:2-iminobutanoate/2-iminopropanoate deaminase
MDSIVKTTVFLANMDDFAAMNQAYASYFRADPPARSAFQVARLPKNGRVEIEAIAWVG